MDYFSLDIKEKMFYMSDIALNSIRKYGGVSGKAYGLSELLYSQFFKNEKDANEFYKAIFPSLKITCAKYGRESEEFNNLLLALAKHAPIGAKKSNFKKRYLKNKQGWKQLPSNPNLIPFGFWW